MTGEKNDIWILTTFPIPIAFVFEKVSVVEFKKVGLTDKSTEELSIRRGCIGDVNWVRSDGTITVKSERDGIFIGEVKDITAELRVYEVNEEGVNVTGKFVITV